MRPLSASELLDVWEQGVAQSPVVQALLLLKVACPGIPEETLAKLRVGQRDACLLTLREWAFGPKLVCLATCPGCQERMELTLDTKNIRVPDQQEIPEVLVCSMDNYEVRFRLPNSSDLIEITQHEDGKVLRIHLLERCVVKAKHNDAPVAVHRLPAKVIDAITKKMEEADPQADVELAFNCPSCGCDWQASFDIVSFFWSEISAWSQRTLHEVHRLASAYGWSERDILAVSPWRRQFYLGMVGQ